MTARNDEKTVASRRRLSREEMAAISPLPAPEDVFADWLVSVPHHADLAAAARKQIALIDRRAPLHPQALMLRTLLTAVAGAGDWSKPISNL